MKSHTLKLTFLLVLLICTPVIAQKDIEQSVTELRVSHLAEIVSELIEKIDSLELKIDSLEKEFEMMKWNQIKEGLTSEDVIRVLGPPTVIEKKEYGFKKYIYGEGYSGYVLIDKEDIVSDSSPPLYLRLEN
ncbi:MAG: hypothetical protein KAQ90_05495 [Melioribacteraceae bacterium]|nr:hypothetical protein [Melioribacteraceae bacterium]